MIEHRSALIVDAELTTADGYAERATAREMLARLPASKRRRTIAGDKNYDTKGFVADARGLGFTPHVAQNVSGNHGLQRVTADEHAQVLKLLAKRHRDLGQLKGKAACRLHALLMELLPGGMAKEMTVNRANDLLDQVVDQAQITQHRVEVAREFVADVAQYEAQMKA